MSMIRAYLLNKGEEVLEPQPGESYRVLGMHVDGAIYQVERINDTICLFKGYASEVPRKNLKFYKIELV